MLESLLSKARINRTLREREKLQSEAQKDLIQRARPLFSTLQDLAEKTIGCAEISDERWEIFREKYPFYPSPRRGPAFVLLNAQLRFLGYHYSDKVGISEKWADFGPFSAKQLAGMESYHTTGGKQELYDEAELMQAHQAYTDMQPNLLDDIAPLLGPLEKFSKEAHEAQKELYTLINTYKLEGIHLAGNFGVSLAGLAECLMGMIMTWPGGQNFIKEKHRDYGFWCRGGQDKMLRPAYLTEKYVQVRVGFVPKWIPVGELAEFIKSQK